MQESIYNIQVADASGQETTLRPYEGNVVLIVNVASQCGYTPQYEGLERLYNNYKDRGLRILAFPSNDYGAQEPGTMEEIRQFCSTKYGVTFDLFSKVHAKGEDIHPLYAWLTSQAEPQGDLQWNFEKFLISKSGQVIGRYVSKVAPDDEQLISDIERALA